MSLATNFFSEKFKKKAENQVNSVEITKQRVIKNLGKTDARLNSLNPKKITKYFKDQKPPSKEELEKLENQGKKFQDPYFPPNINSLESRNSKGEYLTGKEGKQIQKDFEEIIGNQCKNLEWKRITDLKPGNWSVFEDKIEFADIKQGDIGDCYFLASIGALSEYPYLIKEKFRTDQFSKVGYYEVIYFIDGEWQIVFLDDNFPCKTVGKGINKLIGCRPNGYELWAILLEKAWAKINGGYTNIDGGLIADALFPLTGFPIDTISHIRSVKGKTSKIDSYDLFKKIEHADFCGTVMGCGSNEECDEDLNGLAMNHAYSLISAKKYPQKNICLVQVRNPWGDTEFIGDWNENDKKHWTAETKKYFNYSKKNDGIFWMDIKDYIKYFDDTHICYLLYDSNIKSFYFEYKTYLEKPVVFNMLVKNKSKVSITSIFKGLRFNREIRKVKHPFSLVVAQYENPKDQKDKRIIKKAFYKFALENDRNVAVVEELPPGNYVVWSYCSYQDVVGDNNFRYSLSFSSTDDFVLDFNGIDKDFQVIEEILLRNFETENFAKLRASNNYYCAKYAELETRNTGLESLLIFNKLSDKWLEVAVSPELFNVSIFPPFNLNSKKYTFKVPPLQSRAIIGIKKDKSCSFDVKKNCTLKNIDAEIPEEDDLNKFFHTEIKGNDNELEGLRHASFKFIAQDKVDELPTFTTNPFKGLDMIKIGLAGRNTFNLGIFRAEHKIEMDLLEDQDQFPDLKDKIKKAWDELKIPLVGTYTGEVSTETYQPYGKGILIWNNGKKSIGYFKDGKPFKKGLVLDEKNNIIYDGEYNDDGKREGEGILYIKGKREFYKGSFANDKMNGNGAYHFFNGDVWTGNFKDNKKIGIGEMSYNGKKFKYHVEFQDDRFIGKDIILFGGLRDSQKEKVLGNFIGGAKLQRIAEGKSTPKEEKILPFSKNVPEENKKPFSRREALLREIEFAEQEEETNKKPFSRRGALLKEIAEEQNETNKEKPSTREDLLKELENSSICVKGNNSSIFRSLIEVSSEEVKESEEEILKKKFEKSLEECQKIEPFMTAQVLELITNEKVPEELKIKEYNRQKKIRYLGNLSNSGKKNGRGAYFDGEWYYIGYFKNDVPDGLFRKYNKEEKLFFRGKLNEDFTYKKGTYYYTDGTRFEGKFENDIPTGLGTFYYKDGSSWTGNFENGKMNGEGKYFYSNGVVTETRTLKNGNLVKAENLVREDFRNPEEEKFMKKVKLQYPGVIEHILTYPPSRSHKLQPQWAKEYMNDSKDHTSFLYIGQKNTKDAYSGRCAIIFPPSDEDKIKYYVGYIEKGKLNGKGSYYDKDWKLVYKGSFQDDKEWGYGHKEELDGVVYKGFFNDGEYHGRGTKYYPDGSRIESVFNHGEYDGESCFINEDLDRKQFVDYDKGDIVQELSRINCNKQYYTERMEKELEDLKEKYPKEVKMFMDLDATEESLTLKREARNIMEGLYVGEFNDIGFRHGRGVQYKYHSDEYYVGYFKDDQRSGMGYIYRGDKTFYIGDFEFDKPKGNGTYCFENGDVLNGNFNEVGEGSGSYTFSDGRKYVGHIYAFLCHGEGKLFKDGKLIGKATFNLGKQE